MSDRRDAIEFSAQDALAWGVLTDLAKGSAWPAMLRAVHGKWRAISATARQHLLAMTTSDLRAADLADLALSASRQGLRQRIVGYRAKG